MSAKPPVMFKSIATHPEHRGVYALSESGELWCWYRQDKRWERIEHPRREQLEAARENETIKAPSNRKASIYQTREAAKP